MEERGHWTFQHMASVAYLYSALPPMVARLEKTLRSVMFSGQDWMFRNPKNVMVGEQVGENRDTRQTGS